MLYERSVCSMSGHPSSGGDCREQTNATDREIRPGSSQINVLVVYDDQARAQLCSELFASQGVRARTANTTEEALDLLQGFHFDAILTGIRTPDMAGIDLQLLRLIPKGPPRIPVIVLTRYGTIENAIEATRLGALEYITQDARAADLRLKIGQIVRRIHALQKFSCALRQAPNIQPFAGLMGVSPPMEQVYRTIAKVHDRDCPVLILGESGTGKELVARALHSCGIRHDRPFVPVDCSALSATLIEAELFGHIKGAFTGATDSRPGLIESAANGTLFLDEIGDLPLDLQPKLLRVLQEREVRRVGSSDVRPVSARVIAATNRDLEVAIREGKFREDLYFRLNVVQISLPALRERRSDIPLLVNHFIAKFAHLGASIKTVSAEALARLAAYDWPGNVRELENVIERAMVLSSRDALEVVDLPASVAAGLPTQSDEPEPLDELERKAILRAINEAGGSKIAAARLLGIGKTTLYRKLKEYGRATARFDAA